MFRRPKKSIRPRVVTMGTEEDEDNGNEMEVDVEPQPTKITKAEKPTLESKPSTLLSFHHEDEENDESEVFKVKKSSVSRKLIKQRGKEKPRSKFHTEKEKNNDLGERSKTSQKSSEKSNTGLGRILTGREAEAVDMESGSEEDENELHFRRPAKSNVDDALRLTFERDQIPDANLIHEAKKRRQLAREMQLPSAPTVISLESKRLEKSRFIREDDDNDKSDEDDDRLDFSTATNAEKLDREKRVEVFNAAQDEIRDRMSENESDAEMDEWERQQLRKGISKSQMQQAAVEQQNFFNNSPKEDYQTQSKNGHYNSISSTDNGSKEKITFTNNSNAISAAVTIDDIISGNNRVTSDSILKKLTERIEILKISHDRNVGELSRITSELDMILSETTSSGMSKPYLSARYILFQKLRSYFSDLVDCLRFKIPLVVSVEKKVIELMKSRSSRMVERRRKDTSDQLEEINAALRTLSSSAGNIVQAPNMDEAKMKRAAEREGRRTRRRKYREMRGIPSHRDGLSSDDEETEFEINSYKIQMDHLLKEATEIFDDVSEDFAKIEDIISYFLEWRTFDFDSYKESYAFMCISKCIGPLVRLEIIQWDPLTQDLDLNKFSWVKSLLKYNFKNGESFQEICADVDSKLIPSVAEKILIPWIEIVARAKWDPTSASQTRNLVKIIKKLIIEWFVAPNSKPVRNLLACIISKFKESLENDVYIPIFPKNALTTKSSQASVFGSRQFWSGVKLLDNMAVWAGIISDDVLQILALDALLTRYLLLGIRTASDLSESAERAKGILTVIPAQWIPKDHEIEPPNGIQQLIHCLISMVQDSDLLSTAINKLSIQEIAKLLKSLGCALEADMIVSKYC